MKKRAAYEQFERLRVAQGLRGRREAHEGIARPSRRRRKCHNAQGQELQNAAQESLTARCSGAFARCARYGGRHRTQDKKDEIKVGGQSNLGWTSFRPAGGSV